jgi:ATP-dependent DNA ligase
MNGHPFVIDIKLDGERMCCHIDKRNPDPEKQVRWFTRRSNEYTANYGPVMNKFILQAVGVEECVLDGEMCSYDNTYSRLVPFGHNRTIAQEEKEGKTEHNLFYIVFDTLLVRGKGADMVFKECSVRPGEAKSGLVGHLPLEKRRQLMHSIVTPLTRRVEFVKSRVVPEGRKKERSDALFTEFEKAIERGEEGLVVKDLTTPYVVGEKSRSKGAYYCTKNKKKKIDSKGI